MSEKIIIFYNDLWSQICRNYYKNYNHNYNELIWEYCVKIFQNTIDLFDDLSFLNIENHITFLENYMSLVEIEINELLKNISVYEWIYWSRKNRNA